MSHPIHAGELLRTARKLADVDAGSGTPASADLRRATSTAYYALFHQIARDGAFAFLPAASEDEAADVARWYTHTGILRGAELVLTAQDGAPLTGIGKGDRSAVMALRSCGRQNGIPSRLGLLAEAFRSLQVARHLADYDSTYDTSHETTLRHVTDAEAAVDAATWLSRSRSIPDRSRRQAHAVYACFLELAMMRSGGPKGR